MPHQVAATLTTRATAALPSGAAPGADPAAYAHALLVERVNRALRRPADFGGLSAVRSLLSGSPRTPQTRPAPCGQPTRTRG